MGKNIQDILNKYYAEANGGLVQKVPSALNRGEGTEKEYYIYKIDLVGSTLFTWFKSSQTYLKIAHTFLSTVDEITRIFGADDSQVEYAGDSVIAYFPSSSVQAVDVMKAAYFCREATLQMRSLDDTLKKHHFHTKTVLHHGKLIMAKIGPRGDSSLTAIGKELHKACKMEANVKIGESLVSKEFYEKIDKPFRKLLAVNLLETQVPIETNSSVSNNNLSRLAGLLGTTPSAQPALGQAFKNSLLIDSQPYSNRPAILGLSSFQSIATPPLGVEQQYEIKYVAQNYSIKWQEILNLINL